MNDPYEIHIIVALTAEDWNRYIKENDLPRDSFYCHNEDCLVKTLGFHRDRDYAFHLTSAANASFDKRALYQKLLVFFADRRFLNVTQINPSTS